MSAMSPRTPSGDTSGDTRSRSQFSTPASEAPSFSGSGTPGSNCYISRCRDSDTDLLIVNRLERELTREDDEDLIDEFLTLIRQMHSEGKRPTVRQVCDHMRSAGGSGTGSGSNRGAGGEAGKASGSCSTPSRISKMSKPLLALSCGGPEPIVCSSPMGAHEWKPRPIIAQLHLLRRSRQPGMSLFEDSAGGDVGNFSDGGAAPLTSRRHRLPAPLMSSLKLDQALLSRANGGSQGGGHSQGGAQGSAGATWRSSDTNDTADNFDMGSLLKVLRPPKTPLPPSVAGLAGPLAPMPSTPTETAHPLPAYGGRVSYDDNHEDQDDQEQRTIHMEATDGSPAELKPSKLMLGSWKGLPHTSHLDVCGDQDKGFLHKIDLDAISLTHASTDAQPQNKGLPTLGGRLEDLPRGMPEWDCITKRRTAPGITSRRDGLKSHCLDTDWWLDELENLGGSTEDEDIELTLPDMMWAALDCLEMNSEADLSSRLQIERQVAHTAYSSVFAAVLDGQEHVVLKRMEMNREQDSDCSALQIGNVFAEVSVLQHLKMWEGCVKLLETNFTGDQVMLVLERCHQDLAHWTVEQPDRMGLKWSGVVLRRFKECCELVAGLHERHVAHCDIKPSNFLIHEGAGQKLVLSDFGEALLFGDGEMADYIEGTRGTVPYQPPEMFKGEQCGACGADVWALGCMLYEMLTGKLLFPGQGDCLQPSLQGADWPGTHLRWTIQSALCTDPDPTRSDDDVMKEWRMCEASVELLKSILVPAGERPSARSVALEVSYLLDKYFLE